MFVSSVLLPNLSVWASAEGRFIAFEDETLAFFDEEQGANLLVTSEDGFLEHPILPTESGDRSVLKDVSYYTVKPGDTISTIAREFGVDMQTVLDANGIDNPAKIRVGSTLKVLPVSGLLHRVQENETLDGIASKYKVSRELIAKQNNIQLASTLSKDMELIIPGARMIKVQPQLQPETRIAAATPTKGKTQTKQASAFAQKPGGNTSIQATGQKFIWPTKNTIVTQRYGYGHPALDIAYPHGDRTTGIHASAGGKVIMAQGGWNGGYGNQVVIDHGNGVKSRYAHLSKIYVSVGQYVSQGEMIGWMGKSGRVYGRTGLHLHFEILVNGRRVNPASYL